MKRGTGLKRTVRLQARTPLSRSPQATLLRSPLLPCGPGWATEDEAKNSARGQQDGATVRECPLRSCTKWHVRSAPVPVKAVPAVKPRRETGFPAAVKLAVRTRAGLGEIEEARCEACRKHLGRYGGQIQHIVARGMGGTSNPVLATAVNGALLCGLTPQDPDGCHYLAESRDEGMREAGFWLPQGSDPRREPMRLHFRSGPGVQVWRTEDGQYGHEPPAAAVTAA